MSYNQPRVKAKENRVLGHRHKLIEGRERVTGFARYSGDVVLPGMLHLRPVLSTEAHARITSIDTTAAEAVPGVVAVLTAKDLPSRDRIITSRNSSVLAKDRVLFVGQPVVVVAAETDASAQDGADQVLIDYEPLIPVVDLEAAISDDSPVVWPEGLPDDESDLASLHAEVDTSGEEVQHKISNIHDENRYERGDVEVGFAEADLVVEHTYRMPMIHQGYIEPHAAVAEPTSDGITLYTSTQGQFQVRNEVARLMGLPRSKVRVVPMTVGGGFGAKYGIVDPLVAAVALTLKRPARITLSRSEDFLTTTPGPATVITLKTGVRKDGTLTALEGRVLLDNGAFAFGIGGILSLLLGGYYNFPHLRIHTFEVITNKQQAGAYRGPGAPQASFCIETNMDEMARELSLDPFEFRLKNAVEGGDLMPNGKPWADLGLKPCLERLRQHPIWNEGAPGENEGIGLAVGGWPGGYGPAAAVCRVDGDGTVRVQVGNVDISGVNSSLVLIAAEVLGVEPENVVLVPGDTDSGLHAPPSGGSQVTYSLSGAVARAAEDVKLKLLELAADHLEARLEDLEMADGQVRVKGVPASGMGLGSLAAVAESKAGGPGPLVGEGSSAPENNSPAFVAHLVKISVDPDTGTVTPLRYVAVQDVGFALNPMMVEGQIQGGVVQGLGWGLHEAVRHDNSGQLVSGSFLEYDLPKANTVPFIETVLVENPSQNGPFGARGVGEPPVTAVAAAVANAVFDATGARLLKLPITPEDLWVALSKAD
jgi:CO/xanthine dehydrogenase Mo-binding subunit